MGEPVVVQGTAVASPYDHATTTSPSANAAAPHSGGGEGGEKQEKKCRDFPFAILLYGNVAAIVGIFFAYGRDAFNEQVNGTSESVSGHDYTGYIYAGVILGVLSLILTGVTLPIMMCIPELLIKTSLILMLILSGAMMVFSFISGNILGGIFGVIFFLIFLCYARAVWSRIPFASVNLLTACTAIKKNCGVILISYFFDVLAFGWTFLWTVSVMGVWEKVVQVETVQTVGNEEYTTNAANYGYLFLLFLSFFFTHQVIENTVHVTVSGVVGSWWFSPAEESGCCASGVTGSLCRSLTTSFGSICFGSLLVALLQALKSLANSARSNDNQILICIAECILGCLESILEYFNKWAFVYVGLYGYGYIEAGKNVITLFKNRGWEVIIADDLVSNVFFFLSLCVGGICAAIGYGIGEGQAEWFVNSPNPGSASATVAGLGFVTGLVLASIMLSSIASAVNAVIVCFAEGPAEFQSNHPELSQKMRETWLQFYPSCGV